MREIKFRAWNDVAKVMYESNIPGLLIHFDGELNGLDENGMLEGTDNTRQLQLMQYTGLKDKNGKEIYEGDVYSYTLTIDGSHWNEHQIQSSDVVKFEDGAFYHGEHLLSDVIEYDDTLTYLGNIYENPELLEATA